MVRVPIRVVIFPFPGVAAVDSASSFEVRWKTDIFRFVVVAADAAFPSLSIRRIGF